MVSKEDKEVVIVQLRSVAVAIKDSKYTDNKMLVIEVDGHGVVNQFLNNKDALKLQRWVDEQVICGIVSQKIEGIEEPKP